MNAITWVRSLLFFREEVSGAAVMSRCPARAQQNVTSIIIAINTKTLYNTHDHIPVLKFT